MRRLDGRRVGIGELIGTLTMIAITLVAAAMAIGWINSQAQVSEGQYGQSVDNNVNYLREHFVLLNVQFTCLSGTCNQVLVSLYNNGAIGLVIKQISVVNATSWLPTNPKTPVPQLSVVANETYTTALNSAGHSICTTTAGGLGKSIVSVGSTPPAVYTVILPSCVSNTILPGASYTIQVLGQYGNLLTTQATASG